MKIGIFFIDVFGTISTFSYSNYEYYREVERSRDLIEKLICKDELDELIISIVSSEKIERVKEYAKLLESRLSGIEKLSFGYHHGDHKMIYNGVIKEDKNVKCEQMLDNLKILEHNICYYADDSNMNLMIAELYLKNNFPNIEFVLFNPYNNALLGLNNELEKYLNSRN